MELLYQIIYLCYAQLKEKENNKINHYQHLLHFNDISMPDELRVTNDSERFL